MKKYKPLVFIGASLAYSMSTLLHGQPPPEKLPTVIVMEADLTAYCPCVKCCGDFKGKVKGQTASGVMATEGRTLAAPKSLAFGTKVTIDGKTLVVEDRGGAIHDKDGRLRLDVFFNTHKDALVFGRKTAVVIVEKPSTSAK